MMNSAVDLDAYLASCRSLVLDEMRRRVPTGGRAAQSLYDLMLDYPMRPAKGLRPALCIATCRALGGALEAALPSATVLELYHNAFLIHDDVEDGSEKRRDLATLHRMHGVPIAVNVGDAMLAMALEPLLDNMRVLDMGRALRILQTVSRMARESAEGQAIELEWVRHARWSLSDDDYLAMVDQKTGWYSFVAPTVMGALCADAPRAHIDALEAFSLRLGSAFQIQDDVLNLLAREADYGKEIAGDLWEGKHTLMLLHALRAMPDNERERALAILAKPRPSLQSDAASPLRAHLHGLLARLRAEGGVTDAAAEALTAGLQFEGAVKTAEEIEWLLGRLHAHGSIAYARAIARQRATEAGAMLAGFAWMKPSVHRAVLQAVVDYVVERDR